MPKALDSKKMEEKLKKYEPVKELPPKEEKKKPEEPPDKWEP